MHCDHQINTQTCTSVMRYLKNKPGLHDSVKESDFSQLHDVKLKLPLLINSQSTVNTKTQVSQDILLSFFLFIFMVYLLTKDWLHITINVLNILSPLQK